MKIVYLGSGAFGLPVLEALQGSQHTLLGVVTNPDKPQGRFRQSKPNAVKTWALERQVPTLDFSSALQELSADVWIVIAFGHRLSKEMLAMPKICALNVHASLLPQYRGASPIQSTLLNGDSQTGVSVIRLVEALDAGDILVQKKISVGENLSFEDLEQELMAISGPAVLESLELIQSGRALYTPQQESQASLCKKIRKEDGLIRWNESARSICNQIRAFHHWPGSYTFYQDKRILIRRAERLATPRPDKTKPGTILPGARAGDLWVATGDQVLSILELQLEGRRALASLDFLRGFSMAPGGHFDSQG